MSGSVGDGNGIPVIIFVGELLKMKVWYTKYKHISLDITNDLELNMPYHVEIKQNTTMDGKTKTCFNINMTQSLEKCKEVPKLTRYEEVIPKSTFEDFGKIFNLYLLNLECYKGIVQYILKIS